MPNAAWLPPYRARKAWLGSVLHIVPDAAHSPSEPGIRRKAIEALEMFKRERRFARARLQTSNPV